MRLLSQSVGVPVLTPGELAIPGSSWVPVLTPGELANPGSLQSDSLDLDFRIASTESTD